MIESSFVYPTAYWLFLPAAVVMAIIMSTLKNPGAGIFLGMATFLIGWMALDYYLPGHVESWLASQRVYAILFKDFPKDKDHFVDEYVAAFKSGGSAAVEQKSQEMKIIMMEHHVPHYIENAPDDVVHQYIVAETWLLSTLASKDHKLCQRYVSNSDSFAQVWNVVGSEIFLNSLKYNPEMIVDSVDHPEALSPQDRAQAVMLYAVVMNELQKAGALNTQNPTFLCDVLYREYYVLARMPPKQGALALKFILSEDHLKGSPGSNFLKQLLPFSF